jgi:hypothetical protein
MDFEKRVIDLINEMQPGTKKDISQYSEKFVSTLKNLMDNGTAYFINFSHDYKYIHKCSMELKPKKIETKKKK